MKRLTGIAAGIAMMMSMCAPSQKEATTVKSVINGESSRSIAQSIGIGWNLGNQLDAYKDGVAEETSWGNAACTQALIDSVAAAGFSTIRIPITWLGHVGEAPDYKIESRWMERIAEIVGWAEEAGLKAIINIHHDGGDSQHWLNIREAAKSDSVNQAIEQQIAAMWKQIAERFEGKGDFLIFEAFNEIHDGGWGWGENRKDDGRQYEVLNHWNQVFVDAVRSSGGKNIDRYLAVPGYVTNPSLTIEHLIMPRDTAENKIIVAMHYYDPFDYTLSDKYSEWGHTADKEKADKYGDEEGMKKTFAKIREAFVDKGIAVYFGEVGCVRRDNERAESFRRYYLEYIAKAAKENGLAMIYWDNGYSGAGQEQSGLFDRSNGLFLNNDAKEATQAMTRGYNEENEAYTLESIYDGAPL